MRTPTPNSPSSSPSRAAATTTPFLTPSNPSKPPSRRLLTLQALTWRFLARIGFWLHTFPTPSPPAPSFHRTFRTTALHDSTSAASLNLAFYVPADYTRQIQHGKRYPVVVSFHGGGFTVLLRLQTYLQSLAPGLDDAPRPHVVAIIAWYPSLDYRLSRSQRRAASIRPDKALPAVLTDLFDASYLPDPACVTSPYVSPAAATDEALMTALPVYIALYLCEWDMLLREGMDFGERLEGLGKRVRCVVVDERGHGFDKNPWPFGLDWKVGLYYGRACQWLCEVLEDSRGKD
ncbi:hypothetical protein IMSHALPRED_006754 [Imshaugia aleurites]|uniref:Alpha/beta hydrolase fold-3 domain-containing protein n=1 Tax=Imshaugia aleurites TaxID=172621 RepID=A0A8H3ITF0_9LECA|nr:hypothetical protein IMSHALPRED_006754 [Imshaugia aleurites]